MGSYELDQENYLHYTGCGWITTKKPLTKTQTKKFREGKLDVINLDWE
jgi:hypothetical protein